MRLLIAGGGTGGHVLAGVAIADSWSQVDLKGAESVLFVGAQGGIEEKLVSRSGYTLKVLRIGSLKGGSWKRQLKTYFQLPLALLESAKILVSFQPQVVLGVGGYSSGPLVLMAWVLRGFRLVRPRIVILEQNSMPGFTNRILGRFADIIFGAFPGTERFFIGKKVIQTGNPIRSSLKLMERKRDKSFIIFIFGGSQGAIGLNTLVLDSLPYLKRDFQFIHQTGEKDYERVRVGYQKAGITARVEKFIFEMPEVYSQASLLVCRAGSSTLAEVAAVGRAAILVPLPTAADNHQELNARVFSSAGAASLLLQTGATGKELANQIDEFYEAPAKLIEMEKSVRQFYRPKAAEDIVTVLRGDHPRAEVRDAR